MKEFQLELEEILSCIEEKIGEIVHNGMTDLLESSYNLFWKEKSSKNSSFENEISAFTSFLEEVDTCVTEIDSDCL